MSSVGFYENVLQTLMREGDISNASSALIVCGGPTDREIFTRFGFQDITLSNIDDAQLDLDQDDVVATPADAENLPFQSGQFELVCVNAGLHHCASPHRALCEMYRVASNAVLVIEARDSFLMRLGTAAGMVADYEVEAVARNELAYGGWRNSDIPNYIYRWTEREVDKTLRSFDPTGPISLRFFHGVSLPHGRLKDYRSRWRLVVSHIAAVGVKAVVAVYPRGGNNFAFFARKPAKVHPWLREEGGRVGINREWVSTRYRVRDRGRRHHPGGSLSGHST
jgi:ubiquinone/menaquinone biosynthesis C-methylase UbiE